MIAAITITYNSLNDGILEPFLDSVTAQHGCDWHLIIIDNDSRDGTPGYLQTLDHPQISVVLNTQNIGFAAGCNQGFALAKGMGADSILLINNDTEFGPDLFAGLHARLRSSAAAAVSPLIVYHHDHEQIWYGGGHMSVLRGLINVHDHMDQSVKLLPTTPFDTAFAPGCCLLVDADAFERVGQFDTDFFVYFEDAELCVRMQRAGQRIVVDPGMVLFHKASTSTGGSNSDFSIRQINKNHMIFVKKSYGLGGLMLAVPIALAKTALALVIRKISPRQAVQRLRSLAEGLKHRPQAAKPR